MRIYSLVFFTIQVVYSRLSEYDVIDISDILNVDYMPGSLLVLENAQEKKEYKNDTSTHAMLQQGTFNDAFATMGYHRKMMNEYLCRGYVSEQIISEMKSTRIRRRLGSPAENREKAGSLISKMNLNVQNHMLEDEGSSGYSDWLKKSATLEDIYRHYDSAQNRDSPEDGRNENDEPNEDYDAEITGYGYQQSHAAASPSKLGHSGSGGGYPYHPSMHQAGSSGGGSLYSGNSGYGGGGTYFGGVDHMMFSGGGGGHSYGGGHEHTPKHQGGHDDKEKLADLFDIALTALAFLSFGMFIIQVIMCISMTNATTAPAMTMMPMSMSSTGVEPTGGGMNGDGMMGGGGMNGGGNGGNTNGGGTTEGETPGEGGEAAGEGNGGQDGGDATNTGDGENPVAGDGGDSGTPAGTDNGGGGGELTGDGRDEGTSADIEDGGTDISFRGNDEYNGDGGTGEGTTGREDGETNGSIEERWVIVGPGGGTTGSEERTTTATTSVGTGTGGTGTGGDGTGDGGDTERNKYQRRQRRDIPVIAQPNNEVLNELARRVLTSIEAALVAHQDDGNCLRKTLCDNNVYSRSLQSNQKYWIPVWSLGMSWLSGRLIKDVPRATSMLDSLKAALLGLGKADCELMYRDCDLNKERQKRRRRRRKRSTK